MTEAARYFCDEHLKLLSESQVEKFVCFWCAQNKIAERNEAATAALEQAAAQWQPIETAPRDGSRILCLGKDWDFPCFLVWKTNSRIVHAHNKGQSLELYATYFGDPNESDDYGLAQEDGRATHWLPLPPIAAIGDDKR